MCTCTCTHIHMYTHAHTCVHTYTCPHTYVYTHTHICMDRKKLTCFCCLPWQMADTGEGGLPWQMADTGGGGVKSIPDLPCIRTPTPFPPPVQHKDLLLCWVTKLNTSTLGKSVASHLISPWNKRCSYIAYTGSSYIKGNFNILSEWKQNPQFLPTATRCGVNTLECP